MQVRQGVQTEVLLSLALAWAESLDAFDIFVGVNVLDASGYPDCRPAFVEAFEKLGGSIHPREAERFEITHVPTAIRERDRR